MRNARRRSLGIISMTLDYYRFKHTPFSTTTDLDPLFLSPSHHAALMAMLDSVQKRSGLVVITGREGIGKTTPKSSPPFGVEMLTVVASRSPLDTSQGRPHVEPAARYLEHFAKRLEAYQAQGNVAVAHMRFRTQKSQ